MFYIKVLTNQPGGDRDDYLLVSQVLQMISYVSASVNGNTVPQPANQDPTLLWPRFCDRLEAIGLTGKVGTVLDRCLLT